MCLAVGLSVEQAGTRLDEHVKQLCKQSGKSPEELGLKQEYEIDIPYDGLHLWQWFWELHGGRQYGFSSAQPLAWQDIYAWANIMKINLSVGESLVLRDMDTAYLIAKSKINQEKGSK